MLERNYAMWRTGNCDYTLTVVYDCNLDGVSLDDEIQNLYSVTFNIAESYDYSIEADIYEAGDEE